MAELLDDELTFLRSVEQDVQLIRSYLPRSNDTSIGRITMELKRKLNERIIELLEERDAEGRAELERAALLGPLG